MSVLKCLFDPSVSQLSPVHYGFEVVNEFDKKGNPVTVVKKIDDKSIIESNGFVEYWSLDELLKAGINPSSVSVQTSSNDRIQGQAALNSAMVEANAIIENFENETKSE